MLIYENPCVGLWLDQAGATIVTTTDKGDPVVQHVESNVEGHYRLSGGSKSGSQPHEISDEKSINRRRRQQLDRYYERLDEVLGNADRLLILGPGEAKLGLKRFLEARRSRKPRTMTVKTADKMTERQLVAVVRKFFSDDGGGNHVS